MLKIILKSWKCLWCGVVNPSTQNACECGNAKRVIKQKGAVPFVGGGGAASPAGRPDKGSNGVSKGGLFAPQSFVSKAVHAGLADASGEQFMQPPLPLRCFWQGRAV